MDPNQYLGQYPNYYQGQYQNPYGHMALTRQDTLSGGTLVDAATRQPAPVDSLTQLDTELLWDNEDLRTALRAEKPYVHLSINALSLTGALHNVSLLNHWREHFHLCSYARSAGQMGEESAACFDLLACDMGRSIEYMHGDSYVYSTPMDIDDGGSFPVAFRRYREALGIGETTGIAIIQHPDFASLMRIAQVSIVLCDLPPAYQDFPHVRLTRAYSVDAVVDYLCQIRIFDQPSREAESEETSSWHSDEDPPAPPTMVSEGTQTRSPLDEEEYNSQVGEFAAI